MNNDQTTAEFERFIQLQILEHEHNGCRSSHDWNKPLSVSLNERSGVIRIHGDQFGFEYHGIASKFRADCCCDSCCARQHHARIP